MAHLPALNVCVTHHTAIAENLCKAKKSKKAFSRGTMKLPSELPMEKKMIEEIKELFQAFIATSA
jgi:hypothetical protein